MRRSRRESAPFLLPGFFVGILAAFLLALNAVQVDARMTREEITFIVWYDNVLFLEYDRYGYIYCELNTYHQMSTIVRDVSPPRTKPCQS